MSIYRQSPAPAGACPRCRQELFATEIAGIRRCTRCGGVFADIACSKRIVAKLDRGLLEVALFARAGKAPPPKDDGRPIACPECLTEMQRVRVEPAACWIDACPTHGTWFDPGELEDVSRAYAAYRRQTGRTPTSGHAGAAGPTIVGPAEPQRTNVAGALAAMIDDLLQR